RLALRPICLCRSSSRPACRPSRFRAECHAVSRQSLRYGLPSSRYFFFARDVRLLRLAPPPLLLLPAFSRAGTFLPARRASDRPMAIACLRLVTFLPLRPLLSVPRFFLCIALFTSFEADFEYLRAMG